jgi:LCP family protein required for cell wall assembly
MRHKKLSLALIIVILIFLVGFKYIRAGIPFLYELFVKKDIELKQEKEESLNILLLGIGGGTHDGPELTDTIILANINPEKNEVNMFSIPRDLWVPELQDRINSAYAIGQTKNKNGRVLAKAVVEKVTGQPVDYVFVIDFAGFVKGVDHLGGIEVDVKRGFDDYEYPITGKENELCGHTEEEVKELVATAEAELGSDIFPCRYKHLSFKAGLQEMDGQTALEFVRSRHATGNEGSDFSRSMRQQEVIAALRKKMLSIGILLNPVKVFGLISIVQENINTDIKKEEYDDFIKLARKFENAQIKSHVMTTSDEVNEQYGLLVNPRTSAAYRYKWVLTPRTGNGDFDEIHEYIVCVLSGYTCDITQTGISTSSAALKRAVTEPSGK